MHLNNSYPYIPSFSNADRVIIGDPTCLTASICPYGASLVSLCDRLGEVLLSPKHDCDLVDHNAHFGATIGRVAGRIKQASFKMNNQTYIINANNGINTLHGGQSGFSRQWFRLTDKTQTSATFTYTSPDGDQGFPGEVTLIVTYTIQDNQLEISYEATTTQTTPINITNHAYFALDDTGRLDNTFLNLETQTRLAIDQDCIPTGEIIKTFATPYDFNQNISLGSQLNNNDLSIQEMRGYDHPFILTGKGYRLAATAFSLKSQHCLKVYTDAPVLHLYTANWLEPNVDGNRSFKLSRHTSFCLEAESYPNAPNQLKFEPIWLEPTQIFSRKIAYKLLRV